jgi:tetraacyldisaccharide 4'-kinase
MNFPRWIGALLWPLSTVYGLVVRLRVWLYAHGWLKQRRLDGVVISVGNITVGGTGKTPMVIWLAERFLAAGKRVAILSRGYRGSHGSSDEVELMKQRLQGRVLFGIGKDRYAQGRRLEAQQPIDVFLLDDGFQHLQVARDVDIVLIDRSQRLDKQHLLPAGRLRESVDALNRADLIVHTRVDGVNETLQSIPQLEKTTFPASTQLLGFRERSADSRLQSATELDPGPYFAFCGIGNPESFFLDLERWGLSISGRRAFRDHHRYAPSDIAGIEAAAVKSGAKALITTEKDSYNLGGAGLLRMRLYVCVISLQLPDQSRFLGAINTRLSAHGGVAA